MTEKNDKTKKVREFWSSQADLGLAAGSKDIILKKLEIEAILAYAKDGLNVLDIGCGNGITAMEIARRYRCRVVGIDFAEPMVIAAAKQAAAEKNFKGSAEFQTGDVTDLPKNLGKFNLIYTERTLINLPDWPAQSKAIAGIGRLLDKNGLYVMCESSRDGLDKINEVRRQIELPVITPPWHNRYLIENEVAELSVPGLKLESIVDFSSTYYFLSRVVNAWLAKQDNKEPAYDSPVNQLALKLQTFGDMGQTKIWLWRKVT